MESTLVPGALSLSHGLFGFEDPRVERCFRRYQRAREGRWALELLGITSACMCAWELSQRGLLFLAHGDYVGIIPALVHMVNVLFALSALRSCQRPRRPTRHCRQINRQDRRG
jgi:hypothetical protein